MKNVLKVLFISLLSFACYAQDNGAGICSESKQAAFKRFRDLRNARVAYPGDDKIDVTYYKLNLNILKVNNLIFKDDNTIDTEGCEASTKKKILLKNMLIIMLIKKIQVCSLYRE